VTATSGPRIAFCDRIEFAATVQKRPYKQPKRTRYKQPCSRALNTAPKVANTEMGSRSTGRRLWFIILESQKRLDDDHTAEIQEGVDSALSSWFRASSGAPLCVLAAGSSLPRSGFVDS